MTNVDIRRCVGNWNEQGQKKWVRLKKKKKGIHECVTFETCPEHQVIQ